jgi:putative oxidoreductase
MSQTIHTSKANIRNSIWLLVLRIALGIILIWKGIKFILDTKTIESLVKQNHTGLFTKNEATVVIAAVVITILCSLLIMIGLFTRIASFVQLPIYCIKILFIHGDYIQRNGIELILTILIPFFLLLLFAKGAGELSVDEHLRRMNN